jgi:hypothetical protein
VCAGLGDYLGYWAKPHRNFFAKWQNMIIYRANSRKDKLEILQRAREHVEVIRLWIRLMKDLNQISLKKFVQVNKHIENVSKQLTGWQNSIKQMIV